MHEGALQAQGDILYFVHADTRPHPTFYRSIIDVISQGNQFGLFSYRFDSDSRLLRFNSSFVKRDGIFTGGGDQGFFITKACYTEHGGFDTELPIMEDFDLFWRLKYLEVPYAIVAKDTPVSARKSDKISYIKVQLVYLITILGFKWGRDPMKLKRFYSRMLA